MTAYARRRILLLCLALPGLAGCDKLAMLGLPDPAKEAAQAEADGKAIGAACRQAGRAIEDCYVLNPQASKAAVFAGWRDMNDYMTQNNIPVVKPELPPPGLPKPAATAGQENPGAASDGGDNADAAPAEEDQRSPARSSRYR